MNIKSIKNLQNYWKIGKNDNDLHYYPPASKLDPYNESLLTKIQELS